MPPENQNSPESEKQPPHQEGDPGFETLPRIRTMKYDAEHYLKEKNVSFIDMVAKEKQRRDEQAFEFREPVTERGWFKAVVTLVIVTFIGLGGYAGYIYFLRPSANIPTGPDAPRSYFSTEGKEVVTSREHDRAGLFEKLRASRKDRLPSGSVKQVIVKLESFSGETRFASIQDFFSTLDFRPPNDLLVNLEEEFNLFIYYTPRGGSAGLVLEPKNPERALAQMLAWEKNMILDFRNLYFDETIAATSKLFEDSVIRNVDVRILNISDTGALSYAFFGGRYLIISTSRDFMELMINRLIVSPPVQVR